MRPNAAVVGQSDTWRSLRRRVNSSSDLLGDACAYCPAAICGTGLRRDEVDLAAFEVDAHQLHRHAIGEAEALAGALAEQHVARGVELEIVASQLRNVDQAVDEVVVERDEQAEGGDAGDAAGEGTADVVAHVVALEPVLHVAARVV